MFRRSSLLILGAALIAGSTGCRSTCNSNSNSGCNTGHGWFSSNSRNAGAPCQLTSNGRMMEGCFDPISGQPIPCPPAGSGVIIQPGGAFPSPGAAPARPDELPFPGPSDMIRPPGVPFAPPYAAPGTGTGSGTGNEALGMTPKNGTPVKNTPNK